MTKTKGHWKRKDSERKIIINRLLGGPLYTTDLEKPEKKF